MNVNSQIDNDLLKQIEKYIADNLIVKEEKENYEIEDILFGLNDYFDRDVFSDETLIGINNIGNNIEETWQQSVFHIIDKKEYKDSDVYKRAGISKQTFSKIRCNINYQPNKDTAIQMCIGLKLNLDETYDLMGKAGFTLSESIVKDLIVKFFIEKRRYIIWEINDVLYKYNLKMFPENL